MKSIKMFIVLVLYLNFSGCGGGGGVYYPPQNKTNNIFLCKVPLSRSPGITYNKQFFPVGYKNLKEKTTVLDSAQKIFDEEVYYTEVEFNGEGYYLKSCKSFSFSFGSPIRILRKDTLEFISEIRVPRGVNEIAAFDIKLQNSEYLAVYVEQRSTSHSSTFFILDSDFAIVYQEHLLGAEEFGYGFSQEYGNFIVVKSEDFWFPNGLDKPRVNLNGDWLYFLPKNKDEK
jgi:hypothetical protein